MKKLLLTGAACLAFSAPAMAQNNTGLNNSPLSGAYIGTYGGYGWTDADTSGVNINPEGGDYGLFVGYKLDQYLQPNLGINGAIEAHYGWSGADDTVGGVDIEKDDEWGISFRPGISFFESINPYGIIGYRNTTYEASAGGISGDEDYDGFELGIGTELVAMGDFGIRAEYSHVWYGEENGIDPDEDNVRLGLAYHF